MWTDLGEFALPDEKPAVPTFEQYAEQWLAHYVSVACKPSLRRILQGIVRNHLVPTFGTQDLRSITRTQVKTFVMQQQQRCSAQHVRNLVRTLHTICEHALDEEVLDRNPAAKLGKYIPEKRFDPAQAIMPFTSAELSRYLATMREHYPQHYPYFLCLARTGMREGEALGLT